MAYTIADGDIAQVTTVGMLHGQVCENVFHYKAVGTGVADDGNGDLIKLAEEFDLQVNQALEVFRSIEFGIDRIDVQRIHPVRNLRLPIPSAAPNGTNPNPAVPSSVTFNIKKLTDFAGRKFRGRAYFAGLARTLIVQSELLEETFDAIQLDVAPELASLIVTTSVTWEPVLLHLGPPVTSTPITAAATDKILRNQRRRQVGVGI